MATFTDLPFEIQDIIFTMKSDLEERDTKLKVWFETKKRRELFGLANEFWSESKIDIEGSTDLIVDKYKDNDKFMLLMLNAKLTYYKMKDEKFEDRDWDHFEIPDDEDDFN